MSHRSLTDPSPPQERFNSKRREVRRLRREECEEKEPSSEGSGEGEASAYATTCEPPREGSLPPTSRAAPEADWLDGLAQGPAPGPQWEERSSGPLEEGTPGGGGGSGSALRSLCGDPLFEEVTSSSLFLFPTTFHVKLPWAEAVSELPPPSELSSALCSALCSEGATATLRGATLRSGCILLSFDLVAEEGAQGAGEVADAKLAAALAHALSAPLARSGGAAWGALLRLRDAVVPLFGHEGVGACPRPPPPHPAAPAILLPPPGEQLCVPLLADLPPGCELVARLGCADLPCTLLPSTAPAPPTACLAGVHDLGLGGVPEAGPAGRGGLLLLEAHQPGPAHAQGALPPPHELLRISDPATLLLSTNPRLVAEVNASTASPALLRKQAHALACALGAGCGLRLRCRAAALCINLGWRESLTELLLPRGGAARAPPAWTTAPTRRGGRRRWAPPPPPARQPCGKRRRRRRWRWPPTCR